MEGKDILFGETSDSGVETSELFDFSDMEDNNSKTVLEENDIDGGLFPDDGEDSSKKETPKKDKESSKKDSKTETSEGLEESIIEDDLFKEKKEPEEDYKSIALALIKSGEWDFDAIEDPETGEQIPIADLDIDKETFEALKKENLESKKSKLKEEVEGILSEDEKEFLEFKRNGGSLEQYMATYNNKKIATGLDISTEEGKIYAIQNYYKGVLGWSDDRVNKQINRLVKDLELDEEAEIAKAEIEKITAKQHKEVVEKQQTAIKEAEEKLEAEKNELREKLKAENISVKEINNIVKSFYDRDQESGLAEIDKIYLSLRKNPEKALMLHEMLTDPDGFVKNQAKKEIKDDKVKTFKTLKFKRQNKNTSSEDNNVNRRGASNEIELI